MYHKALSVCFAFLSVFVYVAAGAPVQSYQFFERDLHSVQQAIDHMGPHVGSGTVGSVHALSHTYNGYPAVVKIIKPWANGQHMAPHPNEEAAHAHHVGQLLGHGHDPKTNTHYLVMKHMGVSAARSGHDQATIDRLNNEANARYAAQYGVRNKDQNGGNFVYHTDHYGNHRAEIVDWAKTEYLGTHRPKGAPPVEQVREQKNRYCPSCVHM